MNKYQATKQHAVRLHRALHDLVEADTRFFNGEAEGDYPELNAARSLLAEPWPRGNNATEATMTEET